jgi:outer membrane protein assembly factor BamB/tetratricopeptide (TPR) repeat protein
MKLNPERGPAALRAACGAWLLMLACLGTHRAPAAEAATNETPAVVNAVVEPDAEVNTWLTRGAEAVRAGNPDQALPWLLRVLQTDPATLASTNGVTFRPARKLALKLIRAIPERTRAAYRAQLDIAKGAPGPSPAPTDPAALEARYHDAFAGDRAETGFRLAGLHLDQGRFSEARGVLLDLLDSDAVSEARRPELLARLVVACARVGDFAQAERAWAELQTEDNANRWPGLKAEVRAGAAPAPISNAWIMAYGGPSRGGAPAGPCRALATNESWVVSWSVNLAPTLIYPDELDNAVSTSRVWRVSRTAVVAEMTQANRRPADGIVFSAGNRAWMNRVDESVEIDLDSGQVLQSVAHGANAPASRGTAAPPLRGLWVDDANQPPVAASLIGGRVYRIVDGDKSAIKSYRRRSTVDLTKQPCGNALAAYDAATGKPLWRLGREYPPAAQGGAGTRWSVNAIRFVGSPVLCAGRLLAPVDDAGGLGVVALDPESGAALWHTRVAFGSVSVIPPMSPLTVDGTSVYLCNNKGFVSALDACDGTVLWSALYDADMATAPIATNAPDAGETNAPVADANPTAGWEENLTLVEGNAVVALPGGALELIAFHRRSGELLWRRPKPEGVDYAVGRRGAALVVAGAKAVACVDLQSGRERWRKAIGGSSGRGVLRGQEALIPCGWKIQRLRIEDGADLGSMPMQTLDDLPLGNLYVHGDRVLVTGLERLYALTGADAVLAELREQLARQPTAEGYAKRGRLLAGLGRPVEAVADLREAWKLQRGTAGEAEARAGLTKALSRAAEQDPAAAARYRAEAREIAGTDKEKAEAAWRMAQGLERKHDTQAALAVYVEQLTGPDVRIRCGPDWEASARPLAARRIRALLAKDEAGLRALLEKPAEQALAQLGQKADPVALAETAMLFAGTAAGKAAAFQAAQAAAERGDFGIAVTILNRGLVVSPASFRTEIAGELARLYERMQWPRGAARLREEWPRLGGGAKHPEVLALVAAKAAPLAGSSQPPPPWRLKWKKGPDLNCFLIAPSGALYSQSGGEGAARHIVSFGCLSLETGLPRWEKAGSHRFVVPGNVQRDYYLFSASDRIQAREWDAGHLIPGIAASCDVWSGTVVTNEPLCTSFKGGIYDYMAYGTDVPSALSEAGVEMVARGNVLMAEDLLTGKCLWMASVAGTGTRIRVASTMLAPDGSPSAFPTAGHFLALIPDRGAISASVAVDPLTGEELSRRSADAPRNSVFWPGHAFGMRRVEIENQRLVVADSYTGVTNWVSTPDIVIARQQALESGTVLVETYAGELLVLDGADGKVLCRSGEVRFDPSRGAGDRRFTVAYGTRDFVIADRADADGKEIVALDLAARAPIFRGALGQTDTPVAFFGPTLTNLCLVKRLVSSRESLLKVVNEKGKKVNGWTLPLPADRQYPDWCFINPFFTRDLIVLGATGGDILAYEHDPGGEKK